MFRLPDPGHPWRQILSRVPAPPKENFYIVGGWVRDLLLLGPRALGPDIDLVIDGDLDAWARSVAASFKADLRVEQGFLTARILVPSDGGWTLRIDMSRFRREWYERPGELPHVAAGSLEDDAIRRDFTMNAIFLEWSTAKKQIVGMRDPHHGLRDLRKGVVHPVKPGTFREDPTRLFRWARLSVRLGLKSSEPLKKSVEPVGEGLHPSRLPPRGLLEPLIESFERPPIFLEQHLMKTLPHFFPEAQARHQGPDPIPGNPEKQGKIKHIAIENLSRGNTLIEASQRIPDPHPTPDPKSPDRREHGRPPE